MMRNRGHTVDDQVRRLMPQGVECTLRVQPPGMTRAGAGYATWDVMYATYHDLPPEPVSIFDSVRDYATGGGSTLAGALAELAECLGVEP